MIKVGLKDVIDIRVGRRAVQAVYKGTRLVWQKIKHHSAWFHSSGWTHNRGWFHN